MLKGLCNSWLVTAAATICYSLALLPSIIGAEDEPYKTVPLRTHSLYQPYLDSDLQSRWFDYGGSTIIRADQYIRITSDRQHQTGWLWSRLPLTATNWEIEFEFRIHGSGSLYGDGMALWITKDRAIAGNVFGSINKFEGLGIFFDTYKNNRPGTIFPYVMAMLGDGQTEYDHDTDGRDQELAGCSARGIRSPSNMATKGKLTYFQEKYLQLDLMYKQPDTWTTCFTVNNVTLPAVGYLGFTAQTGELADNHDIITISARNLYTTPNPPTGSSSGKKGNKGKDKLDKAFKKINKKEGSGGGWGWFFIKMILFIVVVVGGYVGYTVYRTSKRSSRF